MIEPQTPSSSSLAERLEALARAAIRACDPSRLAGDAAGEIVAPRLAAGVGPSLGRVVVIGAGKASARMASGVAEAIGDAGVEGLVVGKGPLAAAAGLGRIRYLRGSHPEADARSAAAGAAIVDALGRLGPDDLVIAVLSGGASSLIARPLGGLVPRDLGLTSRALLGAGVPIGAINVVRRHLSATAGGRLAAATRAQVEVLVVSDVLGNDLAAVGSGPFSPDESCFADALAIVRGVPDVPARVRQFLERGAEGLEPETARAGDPALARVRHRVIASPETLFARAAELAPQHGFLSVASEPPTGASVEQAAARLVRHALRLAPGELLITGGEPTVVLPPGAGHGGRNQHLALLTARAMGERAPGSAGACGAVVLSIASDGEDGPTDAAGGCVDASTWSRIAAVGIDPARALERADAYHALDAVGALVRTGPTGTNVLDLHLVGR